jgi:hypothetical protein
MTMRRSGSPSKRRIAAPYRTSLSVRLKFATLSAIPSAYLSARANLSRPAIVATDCQAEWPAS